jgi:Prokaryotic N-terminal methylation motif
MRQAFSLLEMLLAIALSMVLLLALYLFMTANVFYAQAGRDVLAEGTIARNIAAKINADITAQVGPRDTRVADYSGGTTTTGSDGTTTTTPNPLPIVIYNTGVIGQPTYIVLSSYRVQKPNPSNPTNEPELEGNSDLRRTYYWLVSNGADTAGLARMEIKQSTSVDADTVDPTTFPEQNKYVFAPEVKNILFEFFDGTTWQPTWDGSVYETGSPPTGAPRAIRITITLKSTLSQAVPAGDTSPDGPIYQQIVAIPTTDSFTPKLATTP